MKTTFLGIYFLILCSSCTNSASKINDAVPSSPFNQQLVAAVKEINNKCPIATDENTRMDSATMYNEFMITYHYTVFSIRSKDVDLKKFKNSMETTMSEKYKTDAALAVYRDNNIAIAYDYKDKNGAFLCYFICDTK